MDYSLFFRQTVFIDIIYPCIVQLKQGNNLLFASIFLIDKVAFSFINGNN